LTQCAGAEAKNAVLAKIIWSLFQPPFSPPFSILIFEHSLSGVRTEKPQFQRSLSVDFDLISGSLDDHQDSSTSPQLLSNLQSRGRLTHEQMAEVPSLAHDVLDRSSRSPDPNQTGAVINKIEDIFEAIADCILDQGKELVIPFKSRPKRKTTTNRDESSQINRSLNSDAQKVVFPSKSPQESWKFSR
jgi:meiotic recombination protein SPO11